MAYNQSTGQAGVFDRVRDIFKPRDVFFHDGATMRRFHVSVRSQIMVAGGLLFAGTSAIAGMAGVAIGAPTVSSAVSSFAAHQSDVAKMESRVAALQAEVLAIRKDANVHAARLEQRQAFLSAILEGKGNAPALSALVASDDAHPGRASADILVAFSKVEAQQAKIAGQVRSATDARYAAVTQTMSRLGINPGRFNVAMGGPYEPVTAANTAQAPAAVSGQADPQFRALFNSWKRLDQIQQVMVSIPSQKPVQVPVTVNSGFGVRSDPFRGTAAMHAGVDIPGSYATPIYATADGVVNRAQWAGGYGNLVELDHGRGIQTRYGHLSSIVVTPGTRVKRGQLIALMGSTGRSTGNHLHYEVRLDGVAVNPIPFLQSSDYLVAMQRRAQGAPIAMGGPVKGE
jgi:murein DD-endopeptidase MepM/ murein hydrolase activator NlpD